MASGSWLGAYVIGGALVYGLVAWQLSKRRNRSNKCARCGAELDAETRETGIPFDADTGQAGMQVMMCPKCANTTARNYRACYYLFMVMGITGILGGLLCVATELAAGKFTLSDLCTALSMAAPGILMMSYGKAVRQWLKNREGK